MTKLERKTGMTKIATSGSLDGMTKLVMKYLYSTTPPTFVRDEIANNWLVANSAGRPLALNVIKSGKRYYLMGY